MRFAIDTGGTFTDLVVESDEGNFTIYKSPTTPDDPVSGVLDVLELAARDMGISREQLLAQGNLLVHATTWALNAVLTGTTGKTAFLTTQGHPDILLFREAGRTEPFNHSREFPAPYVPRSLTYEVPERIGADGEVVLALDEEAVLKIIQELTIQRVEAVAVCFLWSVINPRHELRVGALLTKHLPGVPYTLSHQINPTLREYRRASSTCIDASLKPVMTSYLDGLARRLRTAGFRGRILITSSQGGILDADSAKEAPIHTLKSGPAMSPVAGRHYADVDADETTAIIADAGGTSYDVSLVRSGRIPWTRETWLGPTYYGHMTGFPSVDVRSIGAGGGSIAWVDEGGLLHVGPQSAGSVPGPVCYGRGGTNPTVTDACLILGYLDPQYFLGGRITLDVEAAREALDRKVAQKLDIGLYRAAAAVVRVMTDNMVLEIEEITVRQGIDPRTAVLVAGGGAAGLNVVDVARRLGCGHVIIPRVSAALSAAGALFSDLTADYATVFATTSTQFDIAEVNRVLDDLRRRCANFIALAGEGSLDTGIDLFVEARYPHQIWDLTVPLRVERFASPDDVEQLRQDFHALHEQKYAICDVDSPIEMTTWRARVWCRMRTTHSPKIFFSDTKQDGDTYRRVYFAGEKEEPVDAQIRYFDDILVGERMGGPTIIQSPFTTMVINPGATVECTHTGSLSIYPYGPIESRPDGLQGLTLDE